MNYRGIVLNTLPFKYVIYENSLQFLFYNSFVFEAFGLACCVAKLSANKLAKRWPIGLKVTYVITPDVTPPTSGTALVTV